LVNYPAKRITSVRWAVVADGPVLIHTTFGEVLRALEGEGCSAPQQLALSREGLLVVAAARGRLAAYTLNGRRLRHHTHNDHFQVRLLFIYYY
jgi:hypothetical protein